MRPIVISAHNPMTGPRHLGHYASTMADWPRLQRDHELFIIIDDFIAAILYPDIRDQLEERTLQVAKEFLSTGIDAERSHILLTSMVPEAHELALFTSMAISQAWCEKLYRESFAGLLTSYQRRELGLPRLPSLAEFVYPQIHLATLTVGLGAQFFQGGEEMKGYLPVLEAIVGGCPSYDFRMPAFMAGKSTFVVGTDGRHMASENAIYVSADANSIKEQVACARSAEPLRRLCSAIGMEELASGLAAQAASGKELKSMEDQIVQSLIDHFAPFRESKVSLDDVTAVLERGAIAARERLRETLIKLKASHRIPGYA